MPFGPDLQRRKMGAESPLRVEALGSSGVSISVVRPTGIEPVLRVPETLVISFSLRARRNFLAPGPRSVNARMDYALGFANHFIMNEAIRG